MTERSEVVVALVGDTSFVKRLTAVIVTLSLRTYSQSVRNTGAERSINLAYSILNNPPGMVERFTWSVASHTKVQEAVAGQALDPVPKLPDDVLEDAVRDVWDALAGTG